MCGKHIAWQEVDYCQAFNNIIMFFFCIIMLFLKIKIKEKYLYRRFCHKNIVKIVSIDCGCECNKNNNKNESNGIFDGTIS